MKKEMHCILKKNKQLNILYIYIYVNTQRLIYRERGITDFVLFILEATFPELDDWTLCRNPLYLRKSMVSVSLSFFLRGISE